MSRTDHDLMRRITTIQMYYFMPDHPSLVQEFLWQTLDLPPTFPRVHGFLKYWRDEVQAVISSVEISVCGVVQPFRFKSKKIVGFHE